MGMTLEKIAEKLSEIYNIPFIEGFPTKFTPFVSIKRGNRNIEPVLDFMANSSGILVFRMTGMSSSTAAATAQGSWYATPHLTLFDTVTKEGKVITSNIPSSNIRIIFIGSFEKELILELGITPIEITSQPKVLGLI